MKKKGKWIPWSERTMPKSIKTPHWANIPGQNLFDVNYPELAKILNS